MDAFGKSALLASATALLFAFPATARTWRDTRTITQRVSFTCGGTFINSWAMLHPTVGRKRFDKVVNAIARTYSLGAGRTGNCDA